MSKDPVCGMMVDPATAKHTARYRGSWYYFCHEACKSAFAKNPAAYLKESGWLIRFLNWLAKGNEKNFRGHPPDCCGKQEM